MLNSFSEFKFYQSFRINVEKADDVRFLVEAEDEMGHAAYIEDAILVDISVTGLGFSTKQRLNVGTDLRISIHFRKLNLDVEAKVVRAFSGNIEDQEIIYGVEMEDEKVMKKLLEQYINSFSSDRLRNCLVDSVLREKYVKASDGFEMFSLLLSLFKDMTNFGNKQDFIDPLLKEAVRILNASRATLFLINPEKNELEAAIALGAEKELLKFDYREGIAGTVFTTGVSLNIDVEQDKTRFNDFMDKLTGFKTRSVICTPIYNREDKRIGVIQVLNKKNQDRFTVEDERTMKVLALVFSSVYQSYNPVSDKSMIRGFSKPFDRKFAFIGKTPIASQMRSSISKTKDIETPLLIEGEPGVGKTLLAQIIHHEGRRGLRNMEIIQCGGKSETELDALIFGTNMLSGKLEGCHQGTILFKEISHLPLPLQGKLFEVLTNKGANLYSFPLDVRLLCSSSRDLSDLASKGLFNPDLYEMISKSYIFIDPLRKRAADIPELINYFLKMVCKEQGFLTKSLSAKVMEIFKTYDWPGNVKELKQCMERAVMYNPKAHVIEEVENMAIPLFDRSKSRLKIFEDIPHASDYSIPLKDRLALVERKLILAEIKRHNGNKSKAAKLMGISREALRKKLLQSDEIMTTLDKVSSTETVKKIA